MHQVILATVGAQREGQGRSHGNGFLSALFPNANLSPNASHLPNACHSEVLPDALHSEVAGTCSTESNNSTKHCTASM